MFSAQPKWTGMQILLHIPRLVSMNGLVGSPCSPRDSKESSPKASILRRSAFFTVQLSHPYMTTGKTIALTRWTFVGKVMSLLFNMLSRLIITFHPSSKHLLISLVIPIAAKSLQSCLTLCNPTDGSTPGSPVPGILQARTMEWVAISISH